MNTHRTPVRFWASPLQSFLLLLPMLLSSQASGQATTNPQAGTPPATTPATPPPADSPVAPPRERGGGGPGRLNWWNDAVFYQVFPRSFADSKKSPDNPLGDDGIGDLQGLIDHLDDLNDGKLPSETKSLGITALWLTPIHPSPSYHGYDITDYTDINPQFGTRATFAKLLEACHARGIRVVIDLVPNHCSNQHPWFQAALDPKDPHHDWFIWSDQMPTYKGAWGQRVWHSKSMASATGRRGKDAPKPAPDQPPFYFGMFSHVMPDLNYRNPAVSDAMLEAVKHWLDPAKIGGDGIDGYRLDAIRHLVEDGPIQENVPETYEWLRKFRATIKAANKDAFSIGEVWTSSQLASTYAQGDGLDAVFEFDLQGATIEAVRTGTAAPLRRALKTVLSVYPPNQFGSFLSNHDQTRSMTMLKGDESKMKLAATIMLTGPGFPFIYYGEEIGMTGDKPDENLRTPMQWTPGQNAGFSLATPWQPVNSGFTKTNVQTQAEDPASLLNHYKRLIRVRRSNPALLSGTTLPVLVNSPHVYAILRSTDPDARGQREHTLVVVNMSDKPLKKVDLAMKASPMRAPAAGADGAGAGLVAIEVLNHIPDAQAPAPAPTLDAAGGFVGYEPIAELAPRTGYVLALRAKPTQKP